MSHDADGAPLTVTYNGTQYFYVTNLQGDVVAIVDSAGAQKVSYRYDAWGTPLSTGGTMASTLGQVNPLRYRGYVYDREVELYYLQSRYYSHDFCRFINADDLSYLGANGSFVGYNLFAYCWNNPINMMDYSGESPVSILNLTDYYIIHKMVQIECSTAKKWRMEIYVSGFCGKGFLDLYNENSNEYYEVKSQKAATRKSTERQMNKYDNSIVKDKRIDNPINNSPTRGIEYTTGTFKYGFWDVEYALQEPGLITYTTEYNWNRAGRGLSVVVGVLMSLVGCLIGAPSSVPAFA